MSKTMQIDPESLDVVALATVYLRDPIEGFHRLTLDGELGGKGRLALDPNSCSVNEFGDPGVCTKLATLGRDVTFRLVEKADPSGGGVGCT